MNRVRFGDFVLHEERALGYGKQLIISDLHIGLADSMIPGQSLEEAREMSQRLLSIDGYDELVIAGDMKHEFSGNTGYEWKAIRLFVEEVSRKFRIRVVRGNHDNYLISILSRMSIDIEDNISDGRVVIHHGQSLMNDGRIEVMGHFHPVIRVVDEAGGIHRFPVFLVSEKAIILPAFSRLVKGTDAIRERPFNIDFMAYAITPAGILNFGRLSSLEKVMDEMRRKP